jgi:hypothetical protein
MKFYEHDYEQYLEHLRMLVSLMGESLLDDVNLDNQQVIALLPSAIAIFKEIQGGF